MAKIDKSQYSKAEWKKIKDQRRTQKLVDKIDQNVFYQDNIILCLKHGTKYSADYVNKLYNMVQRNCTVKHEFVCMTDDPNGIDNNIKIINLPDYLKGWWCKPYMFSNELPIKGNILYMDLDVVIAGNIDKLFMYNPDRWATIRDFTRAMRPNWKKYNSSIVRFKSGQLSFIWEDYKRNYQTIQKKFFGDQDYLFDITHNTLPPVLFPDSWVQSWKWEVRTNKMFKRGQIRGERQFEQIQNVKPRIECCICVFHGDPNPHRCEDPWVLENWK